MHVWHTALTLPCLCEACKPRRGFHGSMTNTLHHCNPHAMLNKTFGSFLSLSAVLAILSLGVTRSQRRFLSLKFEHGLEELSLNTVPDLSIDSPSTPISRFSFTKIQIFDPQRRTLLIIPGYRWAVFGPWLPQTRIWLLYGGGCIPSFSWQGCLER